jgi:hypothetical protein
MLFLLLSIVLAANTTYFCKCDCGNDTLTHIISSCSMCTKAICSCAQAICFQRGSWKDQIFVIGFLGLTIALTTIALLKDFIQGFLNVHLPYTE